MSKLKILKYCLISPLFFLWVLGLVIGLSQYNYGVAIVFTIIFLVPALLITKFWKIHETPTSYTQSNPEQVSQTSDAIHKTLPLKETNQNQNERSEWWYLVPFFFGLIGGLIAYFVVKEDDKRMANYCIAIGLVGTLLWTIFYFVSLVSFMRNFTL